MPSILPAPFAPLFPLFPGLFQVIAHFFLISSELAECQSLLLFPLVFYSYLGRFFSEIVSFYFLFKTKPF